jgi:hypothetical protein
MPAAPPGSDRGDVDLRHPVMASNARLTAAGSGTSLAAEFFAQIEASQPSPE